MVLLGSARTFSSIPAEAMMFYNFMFDFQHSDLVKKAQALVALSSARTEWFVWDFLVISKANEVFFNGRLHK